MKVEFRREDMRRAVQQFHEQVIEPAIARLAGQIINARRRKRMQLQRRGRQ